MTLSVIVGAIHHLATLMSLRLLPFVVYGLCTGAARSGRLLIAATYLAATAVACYCGASSIVMLIGVGSLYYGSVGLGVYRLGKLLAAQCLTRGAAFVLLFLTCLLLPGVLLPGVAVVAFLIIGFELLLSGYSYCVETSRVGAARASLAECLFFLLVNPTVMYTLRGSPCLSHGLRGLRRSAEGIALMFASSALVSPLARAVPAAPGLSHSPATMSLAWLVYGALRLLGIYLAQAGLASIQIGLMRQIGWSIPERYRCPLAARSPMEFWRRWNTYFRVWLEAYVFLPMARKLVRTRLAAAVPTAAAIVTLFASGLIHDAYIFAGRQTFAGLQSTKVFLMAGALLSVWRVGAWLVEVIGRHLDRHAWNRFDLFVRVSARVGMLVALAGAGILWR